MPLTEIENLMGSSLPHVWTTNETKPRLIAVALNISCTPWCDGNSSNLRWRLLQGYLWYHGGCFSRLLFQGVGGLMLFVA